MMLARNTILNLGVAIAALLVGITIKSDLQSTVPSLQPQYNSIAGQLEVTPNQIATQIQPRIATLADGNYQFCSQSDPHDWQDGAGVCFVFQKCDRQVSGYYGYPHSDNFICVKGKVTDNLIVGKALEISWAGREWTDIPHSVFKWDWEGRLTLSQGNIVRTINDVEGRVDWIVFRQATLDLNGFYQYSSPRMTPPPQLCEWQVQ
ncbi:hypothetical protein IQ272_01050 [Chroococcidiopsidales cyanobacterium LEGE 13417]|nr:hypothetical protein [Chroococcidiopsidales cyanobacterium LEGE 13417]